MRLVYLMRDNEKAEVSLVYKKPVGVRVSENITTWYFRSFSFLVGVDDGRLLYSDGWTGPIGVFDLDKPEHLKVLFKMSQIHLRSMLEHHILIAVDEYFPVQISNALPPRGHGGYRRTPVGSAIVRVCRHGDEHGNW